MEGKVGREGKVCQGEGIAIRKTLRTWGKSAAQHMYQEM